MKKRVLIVEDSPLIQKMIVRELGSDRVESYIAEDGQKALEMVPKIRPHLITMDLAMPKLNGYEVLRELRTRVDPDLSGTGREIPVIIVTSNDREEERKKGFEIGITDFIIKPFLPGELSTIVNRVLFPETVFEDICVLIAEDSKFVRTILRSILESERLSTICASNGKEAYQLFQKHEQKIDIILTDYLMPKMNGDELCRKIRQEAGHEDLPIILVSNQSKSETIVKLFRAGASDYIVKPFIREELIARLKVHLKAEKLNRKLVGHVHELKRLSKLQNDFLSITSHDLRSPLCGMLGFANLLAEDETLRAHHRKIAGYIKQSGDFLMNMINDILDLGRIQSEGNTLSMKPVPIVELLESSSNTVRHMATPKEIRVELHNHCERNPFISGDRKSITRIFNNILSNAIKFTPDGGRIEQRVTLVSPNRVQITIADNGIGIPSKQIPGLFDRFSRYTRTGTNGEKGTGLGLSITKELVTLHDGTIEVSSEEQKGACFKLYFPTIPPPDKKETFQRTNRVGLAENRAQILLVEDNATSIRLVKSILDQNSCETLYAKNGKEALLFFSEKLRRTSPLERDIDLIFLELDSAKIDGFEVAREIRNREKRFGISPTPIVGITSEHSRESWEKRGEVGISGSLAPPINKQRLNEMIQRYIFIGHE